MYLHLRKNTLGAALSTEVVASVQKFTGASAKAIEEATKKLHPVITGSGRLPTAEVPTGSIAPGWDEEADYWSYEGQPRSILEAQGLQVPDQTVYDQIKGGGTVLINKQSAEAVLAGQPVSLIYLIGKPEANIAVYLAPPTGKYAVLTSGSASSYKKKKTDYTPLLIAAAGGAGGALVAGPIGAVVGAVAGWYVGGGASQKSA